MNQGFSQCPLPISPDETIRLAHGSGGRLTQRLIQHMFRPAFSNAFLDPLHDGAVLPSYEGRLAFTTDAYVVHPLFFPGGDIGSLAVYGTINDLAMCGAVPRFLSASFIIEEGLSFRTLHRVVTSMAEAAAKAGVHIVCGDTKVVDRGKGDELFIATSGLGSIPSGLDLGPHRIASGDRIVVSGDLGNHGMAVLSQREGLTFAGDLRSDSAPLHKVVQDLVKQGVGLHCLRDLTRGGLASALHELANGTRLQFCIDEPRIPVMEPIRGACELLGLDPLYVANEGRFVLLLPASEVDHAVAVLQQHEVSRHATEIGHVRLRDEDSHDPAVLLRTLVGTERILDMLSGEQLPRIC
ncbi:MAG: hydrogenase expression/formation protein HypE [Nitrospirae bacterium]|nr:MAG: hydrogenase expression/formation protein HypE [Nitrospirota bacterium]